MKIMVTGAAGFIGSALSKALLERGDDIFGVDNLNDYCDIQLKLDRLSQLDSQDNFEFIKQDLSHREQTEALFKSVKPQRVVHLAAQAGVRYSIKNPHAYIDANIVGFMNILEGCRHNDIEHLVYASSSSVYGANTKMPFSVHHNVDHPFSLYGATKKANELMAHSYSHLYKLSTTGLRFFTVYGPWGRPDMSLFIFTKKIFAGETIDVFNNGHHSRDFTYIDDIVEGVIRIVDKRAESNQNWSSEEPDPGSSDCPYKLYNIGNNNPVELMHFIELIEGFIGIKAKKNFLPMQAGDVPATYADVDALIEEVAYSPSTPIDVGIARFVQWYKSYYGIEK